MSVLYRQRVVIGFIYLFLFTDGGQIYRSAIETARSKVTCELFSRGLETRQRYKMILNAD